MLDDERPVVVDTTPLVAFSLLDRLGALLRAKQRGLVEALSPLLGTLLEGGFRLAPKLVARALELAGEPTRAGR